MSEFTPGSDWYPIPKEYVRTIDVDEDYIYSQIDGVEIYWLRTSDNPGSLCIGDRVKHKQLREFDSRIITHVKTSGSHTYIKLNGITGWMPAEKYRRI